MTVVRARTKPGARTILRGVTCGLGAAIALLGSGCGGSTSVDNGTPVVTITDTNGDFTQYAVYLTGVSLTRSDGSVFTVFSAVSQTALSAVDLTKLSDLSEVLGAPALATGTYTSATIALDYTNAIIAVNVNGQSQTLTPVDTSGNAVTGVSFTVKFDPANPLVISHAKSSRLALDFDLAASNLGAIDLTNSKVTVKPFVVATAKPTDTKTQRVRGPFLNAETDQSDYIINVRPNHDLSSDLGAFKVKISPQTYFNVNGTAYTGTDGLNAMKGLAVNTPTAAFGSMTDLSGVTPVFTATSVYAGTSLESVLQDHVSGVVTQRSGNTLTVHGATCIGRLSSIKFINDATVNIGGSTVVSQDGQAATGLSPASISVGQLIDVSGQETSFCLTTATAITLDATAGQARLAPTTLWGRLNAGVTPSSAPLNLLSLGDYEPAAFNFAGTGSAGSSAPANYIVNTGSMNETGVAANTLLKVAGFVNAFGAAPPDFNATAITPETSAQSQLIAEWVNGGAVSPFTMSGASGLVINLGNANLSTTSPPVIRTGPSSKTLSSLPASPLITTASADPNAIQLAIGNAANGISVFNTAAGFATQLGTTLNGSTAVYKLVATGRYDSGSNTFNATSVNIALQ